MALLVFVYLIVPGSGRLVWDGLPLSTRSEFAALVLWTVVFLSGETRKHLREVIARTRWAELIRPVLAVLCLLKFLSFAWSPLGAGFGACYRSLYIPLKVESACEKSFEAPFVQSHGYPYARISRVDPVVDFGEEQYDWSLPFVNHYPRVGAQWLERLPFSVKYSARVTNPSDTERFIPIRAIGEITTAVNRVTLQSDVNYDRHFLQIVPIQPGDSVLNIKYQYRDDDLEESPDVEPPARGPYAQLKVGAPMTVEELSAVARIRVIANVASHENLRSVLIIDRANKPVQFTAIPPPEESSLLRPFDVEIEVGAAELQRLPLKLIADINGSLIDLARIVSVSGNPLGFKVISGKDVEATAMLTTSSGSIAPLVAGERTSATIALEALSILLDFATLLVLVSLAYITLRFLRKLLMLALGIATVGWLVIDPVNSILPEFVGGGRELVLPYALVALLVVTTRRSLLRAPLISLLPLSVVLASQKIFEHIRYNHPGHGQYWWGKLVFFWRDSDWFNAQGNARAILETGSLQGGENVFWLQFGPRYLAFFARLLLGENDILIGIISMTIGFLVVCTFVARFAQQSIDVWGQVLAVFVGFICLIFLGDQIVVAFAFVVSSEYPTWVAILAITAFFMNPQPSNTGWAVSGLAILLAANVAFRPNNLFVSITLLLILLAKVSPARTRQSTSRSAWAVAAFCITISLGLVHNLYYGQKFVPFTSNASINYVFEWTTVWSKNGVMGTLDLVWSQLRALMYWRVPHDPNFLIFFWGSQLVFLLSLGRLYAARNLRRKTTLTALIPLTYVLPMLNFSLTSYYPRHLVTAGLLCLSSSTLIWQNRTQRTDITA